MKVAILGLNYKNIYSGGRIHALTMAYGLAANSYKVDYYTNVEPVFLKDFKNYPGSDNLKLIITPYFQFANTKRYDLVILVPHLASKKSFIFDRFLFYPAVKKIQDKSKCPLWFLDFESPNWVNEVMPGMRDLSLYKYSNEILPRVNAILSTTKTGMSYAQGYYSNFNANLKYLQLYLAINSVVADTIGGSIKQNKVVFFGRFTEKHKNPKVLINVIESLPGGYQLLIIGNKKKLSEELATQMDIISAQNNIEISFVSGISEEQKYIELASSKLLIYSSTFEGYGLPPLEAQYIGTPVLCSDIPVLREVNKKAEFVNFDNKEELKSKIDNMLNSQHDKEVLKTSVSSFAGFDNYTKNIKYLVESI